MTVLLFSTALAASLVSGIFYAFSTFVMRALGRLAPREGIAAMQSINVAVINPLFFLAFFGTGLLCFAVLAVVLLSDTGEPLVLAISGCILYLVGCIGVTIFGNVPLNERLANADPGDDEAESLWGFYLSRWTLWNHARTAASLAAAACLVLAIGAG